MKTKAPLRISFAGGGTDVEPYVSQEGSIIIAAAIKMYVYATFPGNGESEIEQVITSELGIPERLSITNEHPPMSGLGGSASCFVAGIKAVNPELGKEEIAKLAFHLERNVMGVVGGKQDQYMAAYGGLNYLEFNKHTWVEPLEIPQGLEELLLLVYMGKRNNRGQDIIQDQMHRMNKEAFSKQKEIAKDMKSALESNWVREFGRLLNDAWIWKLQFSPLVASFDIQEFYNQCLDWGAIGGKLTGAGGGGYMLLMEDPSKKNQLRQLLLKHGVDYKTVEFDMEGVSCESSN